MRVACIKTDAVFVEKIDLLSNSLSLPLIDTAENVDYDYLLAYNDDGALTLTPVDKQKGGSLTVDFDSTTMDYRRSSASLQEDISKAVGCKSGYRPSILDLTAGLGGDAFVLACLGCDVSLVENNPVIYALLEDGLQRASRRDSLAGVIACERLHLQSRQDAIVYLADGAGEFDVVYLDPMFPDRQKSAKVKKAMQYFHDIVGCHHDQENQLLELSLQKARKRVVVKRPKLAPLLGERKVSYQIKGKSVRYDIYLRG